MSENRMVMRKNRKKQVLKQKVILFTIAFSLIICLSFALSGFMTSAHDKERSLPTKTSYISVQIESGDSLWSIAEKYKPANQSTNNYIDELITLNGLTSEDIHADQYLTIVCYETELI